MKYNNFRQWLEMRDPDINDIKDALIGAIPDKVKSAAGVSGSSPQDHEILLGKPVGVWEKDSGIVNAILQQGVIKTSLTPEKIDQIQNAVKEDEGNSLTFKDILDMIVGANTPGTSIKQPPEQAPAPDTGGPPPGAAPMAPPSPQIQPGQGF